MDAAASFRPAGALPAVPLAPYNGPWDARLAAHLLRRAAFGGSPADIARLAELPPPDAVSSLIRFSSTSALPARPDLLNSENAALLRPATLDADQRKQLMMTRRQQERANI